MRYGEAPPGLRRDGSCDTPFTLQHALSEVQKGWSSEIFHNEIRDELVNLAEKVEHS